MTARAVHVGWAVLVALWLAPLDAGAQGVVHSPLDPVRLAADSAPAPVAPLEVLPFELAAADSFPSHADSIPAASPTAFGAAIPPLAPRPATADEQPPIVGPIVGAIVGGAIGLYGGAGLSLALFGGDNYNSDDLEDVAAVVLGASVGEVFLMPAGAHLGNGGKGSYWSALGGSALGFLATLGLSYLGPAGAIAGVGLQVALTVSGERRSANRKAAERAALERGASPAP